MNYIKCEPYDIPFFHEKMMGPNPIKLEEELLMKHQIPPKAKVLDLGCGQGITSLFLAKEYGFFVYAGDLWSEPEDNQKFFTEMGLSEKQIKAVKADAECLPFEKNFFDAVVTTDSYHYFGRNENYLDEKLLPFVKKGGLIYIAIPGMKKDCHENLPKPLLLSWTPEDLETMHDVPYWEGLVNKCTSAEVLSVKEMESNKEVWDDWLKQENPYAVGDRKSMHGGADKYLNFISIVLKKK